MRCDFCNCPEGPQPYKPYWPVCRFTGAKGDFQVAVDFDAKKIVWEGNGPWLACARCASLIDAKLFGDLLTFAMVEHMRAFNPEPVHIPALAAFIIESWTPLFGKDFMTHGL